MENWNQERVPWHKQKRSLEDYQEINNSIRLGFQNQEIWYFWARLVACRYSQIPGVDFSENYLPVVHNITFGLLLVLKIVYGFSQDSWHWSSFFMWRFGWRNIYGLSKGTIRSKTYGHACLKKFIHGLVQASWHCH